MVFGQNVVCVKKLTSIWLIAGSDGAGGAKLSTVRFVIRINFNDLGINDPTVVPCRHWVGIRIKITAKSIDHFPRS